MCGRRRAGSRSAWERGRHAPTLERLRVGPVAGARRGRAPALAGVARRVGLWAHQRRSVLPCRLHRGVKRLARVGPTSSSTVAAPGLASTPHGDLGGPLAPDPAGVAWRCLVGGFLDGRSCSRCPPAVWPQYRRPCSTVATAEWLGRGGYSVLVGRCVPSFSLHAFAQVIPVSSEKMIVWLLSMFSAPGDQGVGVVRQREQPLDRIFSCCLLLQPDYFAILVVWVRMKLVGSGLPVLIYAAT
ncbi:hypothetical protein U9M48_005365 [Paspalum notatum var. saurae]|uniref:Uncharacterized protein n=1 Tax=Paspalum notatum var. saurae TaxID=547442 RepID=A0AAQ3PWR9_PASNO